MQIFAIVVSLAITAVAVALFARTITHMLRVIRIGQPANRTDHVGQRLGVLVKESLLHTRMLQWTKVGIGHWFIFVGFGLLFFTLVNAYGQLFDPHFVLPVIGHFPPFEWITEAFTWVMLVAIVAFIVYRATRPSERTRGEKGRFYGSTMWQGYFVEAIILLVGLAIITLRALEYAIAEEKYQSLLHFPLTAWMGQAFTGLSTGALENLILLVAMIKIVVSMIWMITISLTPTMGVAWHRFTVFFNIFFKRKADGGTALGALPPMTSGGKVIDFEDLEEMDEDTTLGVGKIEDFSWKGILDFTTCTECGRCQSQCPAWNTDKPLSPKLLITNLRNHAYAKAPYLLASEDEREKLDGAVLTEAERPLVGETEGDWAWMPEGGAVIDSDVLWSCTSCGACVQQCPVDIEHVDHIVDMRRYQVLVESNFPAELNGLFKGLENKGNPWNMSPNARLEWAQGLPFDVKVVGEDIESLDEVDWLFWVGCAGAYEDRAKKTTRAVAELLDMAGVSFGVLGNGETCTGDPARRAGNEFVFQGLASQNAETFKEMKVKKAVTTCAHCFNTLKNEYAQFGVELEVVHHTQLLNRLVREGKLTPVATNGSSPKRSITYHDPCYLGRHNQVYSPPRELLNVIPDAQLTEMPRNSERSFCCGAGGARMWMEEKIGERINLNRTTEAVGTGAEQIATGCPFCRVMLSDGLTAMQADGSAREEVEVLDVAQMLLASVKGESRKPVAAGATAKAAGAGAAAGAATKAEPSAGDVTQTANTVTETEEVGANAAATEEKNPEAETSKAISSGSLFDAAPEAADAKDKPSGTTGTSLFDADSSPAAGGPAKAGGGSLFDTPAPAEEAKAEPKPAAESAKESSLGSGSLFDTPAPAEEAKAEPAPEPAAETPASAAPASAAPAPEAKAAQTKPAEPSLGTGGSLFDVAPSEPEPAKAEAAPAAEPEAKAAPTAEPEAKAAPTAEPEAKAGPTAEPEAMQPAPETPDTAAESETSAAPAESKIDSAGSLFDIAPSEPEPAPSESAPAEPEPAPEPASAEMPAERAPAEPAAEPTAEPEPPAAAEPKSADETPASAPAAPASSGEKHEPKKGGIEEGQSLFDI
ncbi:(Fe-S)-binding protein [Nocardioides pakistanensis]